MKLNEYMENGFLFGEVNTLEPFPFLDDSAFVDMLLVTGYGERTMFKPVQEWDYERMAKAVLMNFSSKWKNYVKQEALNDNVNSRREITETINNSELRTNERNDLAKVSAFNSDALVTDTGADSSGSDDLTGERVRTLTDVNISTVDAYNALSFTSKTSIIQKVISDTASFMTLAVY